ncbi:MAG: hypothetical protein ACK4MY_15205 [Brevundimonas sp.]
MVIGMSSPRRTVIGLSVITVLSFLAVVPAAGWAAASIMALQPPPSVLRTLYVWSCLSLPLALIIAPLSAWMALDMRRPELALVLGFAPVLWILVIGLVSLAAAAPCANRCCQSNANLSPLQGRLTV